jgi:hypothetical protein
VHGAVGARLREQFAPAYLTLTSIIQGVALSTLVARVEATSAHFDAANWLLAAATLVGFLAVWQEYLMQALAYRWLPTLLDSAVPFGFLVAELFMAHFVYGNERAWWLATGLAFAVGGAAWWTTRVQAHGRENADVLRAVADLAWVRLAISLGPAALCLGVWAFYDALGLARARLAVAVAALLLMGAVVVGTVPYWNRVLAQARSERPQGAPRAE